MLGHVFWSIRHCILISRNLWLIRFLLSLHLLGQFEEAISRVSFFPDVTVVGIILLLVGFKECQDICSLTHRGVLVGTIETEGACYYLGVEVESGVWSVLEEESFVVLVIFATLI